ncbi:TetR family transcriptional regulator [Bifidobacterium lemurum]|uniref:TetR family transcriptional regulator n=1 Tax=Bifidobacterium lemurum TaxID=1603886 RepID=A0A261FTB3_9BIFI|nr:TetR/AcrR family transcriptional regulator [Bifidobacterium lemurum]OZG62422.1 TetR family transcriptional regulator [Bifidobacterium lemurum]QOL33772.1 TetR/AcrR family transcriptional regulator [Bifidobacterium lemurum]
MTSPTGEQRDGDAPSTDMMGLRERKKLQQRDAIERAMLTRVLELGYDRATIEDVCDDVGISKKTFFNYYHSKDAAILGIRHELPDEGDIARRLGPPDADRGSNYLDTLVDVMMLGFSTMPANGETAALRKQVIRKMPQMMFHSHRMTLELQHRISRVLRTYLQERPDRRVFAGSPADDGEDAALDDEIMLAASTATSLARMRYMQSLREGDVVPVPSMRAMLTDYLDRISQTGPTAEGLPD